MIICHYWSFITNDPECFPFAYYICNNTLISCYPSTRAENQATNNKLLPWWHCKDIPILQLSQVIKRKKQHKQSDCPTHMVVIPSHRRTVCREMWLLTTLDLPDSLIQIINGTMALPLKHLAGQFNVFLFLNKRSEPLLDFIHKIKPNEGGLHLWLVINLLY